MSCLSISFIEARTRTDTVPTDIESVTVFCPLPTIIDFPSGERLTFPPGHTRVFGAWERQLLWKLVKAGRSH